MDNKLLRYLQKKVSPSVPDTKGFISKLESDIKSDTKSNTKSNEPGHYIRSALIHISPFPNWMKDKGDFGQELEKIFDSKLKKDMENQKLFDVLCKLSDIFAKKFGGGSKVEKEVEKKTEKKVETKMKKKSGDKKDSINYSFEFHGTSDGKKTFEKIKKHVLQKMDQLEFNSVDSTKISQSGEK